MSGRSYIIFGLTTVLSFLATTSTYGQVESDTEALPPDYSIPENILNQANTLANEIDANRHQDPNYYKELRPAKDSREQTMNALGYAADSFDNATRALGGQPAPRK